MIKRYASPDIEKIWADENKIAIWQKVELAVMAARVKLGLLPSAIFDDMQNALMQKPADLVWWKAREEETQHDLQAWIDERVRHLAVQYRPNFHDGMTSFDTEEPAFAMMLRESDCIVDGAVEKLLDALRSLAIKYRYTPMMGVTHGQSAELQTFGKRCLTWWKVIFEDQTHLREAHLKVQRSKTSGAIGNYGGVTPEIEAKALEILGLEPFIGATQVMPREVYTPLAQALCQLVQTIDKIATDIRLGARSPRPIYQEPFGKKQTGSSRMPQKKNTIKTEQMEGMARMALGYLNMIMMNIKTWEERAIEQSCVERVAWPDLFHVVMQSLKAITRVLEGLQVYPDNMMRDIIDTRGTYAAGAAKEFLRENLAGYGITTEHAYRMVQLAAFMCFQPSSKAADLRNKLLSSWSEVQEALCWFESDVQHPQSIQQVICEARLRLVPDLDVSADQVGEWNRALRTFFADVRGDILNKWNTIFSLENRLRDEASLFQKVFCA